MIEIFAGVLTGSFFFLYYLTQNKILYFSCIGSAFGGKVSSLYHDFTTKQNVGHLLVVIRPDLFMPLQDFKARMDSLVATVKSQPLAEVFSSFLLFL